MILGIVHSLGSGTDAWQPWFLLALGATAAPATILLLARLVRAPAQPSVSR